MMQPFDDYLVNQHRQDQPSERLQFPELRILLVEDNLTNQKLTLRQLRSLGYCADVVSGGQAAIDAVVEFGYDVVLMDCQMPDLDGFEATAAIRQWEAHHMELRSHQVVIIAMTASTLEQDRERAMRVGMNDYLIKPVSKEALAALLTSWGEFLIDPAKPSSIDRMSQGLAPFTIAQNNSQLHLDWNYLHALADHDSEFEFELLNTFIKDSHVHLELLQQAILVQDASLIEQLAHHIRGASANIGAKVMQFAAEQIELNAVRFLQHQAFQPWITDLDSSLTQIQSLTRTMALRR